VPNQRTPKTPPHTFCGQNSLKRQLKEINGAIGDKSCEPPADFWNSPALHMAALAVNFLP
jgi:hypothetical protein